MSGQNGTMNGKPCWSPATRTSYGMRNWTSQEVAKAQLLDLPRLIQSAIAKGLVKLPEPEPEPETHEQLLASFPAAVDAAIKAGLIQRPEPVVVQPKPKLTYTGPMTKPCKCGAVIHINLTACRACRIADRPKQPCAHCGTMFQRANKEICCTRECGRRYQAKQVTEAALRRQPRPPQICTVCGVEFPWRYTRTKLPAKTCTAPCTKEAARRKMRELGKNRKKN